LPNSSPPTISIGTGESATERGAERVPTTAIRSTCSSLAESAASAAYEGAVPNATPTARANVVARKLIDMLFPSKINCFINL